MKKIFLLLLGFCAGVVLMFGLSSYSLQNARFIFSDSVNFADGSSYTGGVDEQGLLNGYGRLVWANGDQYEGEFVAGLFQGKGTLTLAGNSVYEGEFSRGAMSGSGLLVYEKGSRYKGDFKKNKFEGMGKLNHINGSVYEGSFHDNEIMGRGKWIYSDKSSYVGEVKNGLFHGKGEWIFANGNKYTGDLAEGKMEGKGVYKTSGGDIYSGEFSDNVFSGSGLNITADGDTFSGLFLNWQPNGAGIKTNKNGDKWMGKFKSGELDGAGTYAGVDGEIYSGEFKYDSYSGKGKLIEKNGDIYEGEFDYHEKDGWGLLRYKEPIDGVTQVRGRWKNGRLVEGDENLKIYSPEEVSDYAIEHQQAALQQALAGVQPSDSRKIELYSLVVAAYGTQEVFRRESKFIENLFSQRYANNSTALYLTNSQRSLGEHPLATLSGIRRAIQQLAEKMDKENDIFFLYITSHGSKDGKIALDHNGLGLGDIDSKWLGDILKESGIKHKVIVLSACYSGGFIADLKDNYSVIMTSASAERTSFGCSDDSHFTYFAKAYFKESLTPDSNFVDAFYKAKELVAVWEKNEHEMESYPQIYTVPEVVEYIKNWTPSNQP